MTTSAKTANETTPPDMEKLIKLLTSADSAERNLSRAMVAFGLIVNAPSSASRKAKAEAAIALVKMIRADAMFDCVSMLLDKATDADDLKLGAAVAAITFAAWADQEAKVLVDILGDPTFAEPASKAETADGQPATA